MNAFLPLIPRSLCSSEQKINCQQKRQAREGDQQEVFVGVAGLVAGFNNPCGIALSIHSRGGQKQEKEKELVHAVDFALR